MAVQPLVASSPMFSSLTLYPQEAEEEPGNEANLWVSWAGWVYCRFVSRLRRKMGKFSSSLVAKSCKPHPLQRVWLARLLGDLGTTLLW